MKITLTPADGAGTFTPGDLVEQLNRWVTLPMTGGHITARCTIGGKIRDITLDVEPGNEAAPHA